MKEAIVPSHEGIVKADVREDLAPSIWISLSTTGPTRLITPPKARRQLYIAVLFQQAMRSVKV